MKHFKIHVHYLTEMKMILERNEYLSSVECNSPHQLSNNYDGIIPWLKRKEYNFSLSIWLK